MMLEKNILEIAAREVCEKFLNSSSLIELSTFKDFIIDYKNTMNEIDNNNILYEDKLFYSINILVKKMIVELPFLCDYNIENHHLINQVAIQIENIFRPTILDEKITSNSDYIYQQIRLISTQKYINMPLDNDEKEIFQHLYFAIKARNNDLVKNILSQNTINLNKDNCTAFYNAIVYKDVDIMETLVEYGADISYYYYSPIINSYRYGSIETTDFLLSQLENVHLYQNFSANNIKKRHRAVSLFEELYDRLDKIDHYRNLSRLLKNKHQLETKIKI